MGDLLLPSVSPEDGGGGEQKKVRVLNIETRSPLHFTSSQNTGEEGGGPTAGPLVLRHYFCGDFKLGKLICSRYPTSVVS